jgi:septal ring factor EnvC (AmiA/AmiB activator)
MPKGENDISGKVGLDITEFKNGVSQLNREIRVIESGFKAAAAGTGDWSKDADTLKARIDSLSKIIELQKDKVDKTREAYEAVAREQGESSKAAQDLAIKLNKETEALNKSERQMREATDALDKMSDESKDAEKKAEDLAKAMEDLGPRAKKGADMAKAAVVAAGAAAAAAAVGIFKLTTEAGKAADELITMSNKTGISTQQLQEMEYASRFVDVEVKTMTDSMMKLTKNMDNADKGIKDQIEAFEKLGVEYKNTDGTLRNAKDVWADVVDALGQINNEAERDAISMRLFGRSAQELNPLVVAGGDSLNKFAEEARSLGLVMSDESVAALGQFDDKMQKLDASTKILGASIATAALPVMDQLISFVQNLAMQAQETLIPAMENVAVWFQQSLTDGGLRWLIDNKETILAVITGIATGMVAWNVVGLVQSVITVIKAWHAANVGLTAVQKVLNLVLAANPIGLVITAIAALVAGIMVLWNTNEGFRKALTDAWNGIKDAVLSAIQSVKDTIASWKAVGEAIIDGIKEGVLNAAKRLARAVVDAAKAALDAAKKFLGVKSPSTVFRDQVGLMIGAGMAEGIKDSSSLVDAAMSQLSKKMTADATVKMNASAGRFGSDGTVTQNITGLQAAAPIMNVTIQVRSAADAVRELSILSKQLAVRI